MSSIFLVIVKGLPSHASGLRLCFFDNAGSICSYAIATEGFAQVPLLLSTQQKKSSYQTLWFNPNSFGASKGTFACATYPINSGCPLFTLTGNLLMQIFSIFKSPFSFRNKKKTINRWSHFVGGERGI